MREPCPQQVFGGCDPSSCNRQCSSTITAHERPSAFVGKRDLASFIIPAALFAPAAWVFIAAADYGLSKQERDYQLSRRV